MKRYNFLYVLYIFLFISSAMNSTCLSQTKNSELELIFMQPDSASSDSENPLYTIITNSETIKTYKGYLKNEPAEWALFLYSEALKIAGDHTPSQPVYHIAIVSGGNNAAAGFRLRSGSEIKSYPNTPYIILAPDDWIFTTTFLHETGHAILSLLNGGRHLPYKGLIPIPHSTAALSERSTAFDEGFAIHLETLAGYFCNNDVVIQRYRHNSYLFGIPYIQSEYHRQVSDLLTYSQSRSRYYDVAENIFAFNAACREPEYFRVQLEKTRDFSSLRNANQLLQSEGFNASFFYSFLMRNIKNPSADSVKARQIKMLKALKAMFASTEINSESPLLLHFVENYIKLYPKEAAETADVFSELTHGVFTDKKAHIIWREHYLKSLQLDLKERNNTEILNLLARWKKDIVNDPKILYSNLGPQIKCSVPGINIDLPAFKLSNALSFDINTVEEGIIKMIPQISDKEVSSFLNRRAEMPFSGVDDFKTRSGLNGKTLERLVFE